MADCESCKELREQIRAAKESYSKDMFDAGKIAGELQAKIDDLRLAISLFAGHPQIADAIEAVIDKPALTEEQARLRECALLLMDAHLAVGGAPECECPECGAPGKLEGLN